MSLFNWKHKDNNEVISQHCYNRLPDTHQDNYESTDDQPTHQVEEDNGSFATSFLMGEVTGSALLGGAIGGDFAGGLLGSML